MHIEILVEDSSGQTLLETLVPKILGAQGDPHTWRIHFYKGVGRIPKTLMQEETQPNGFCWINCRNYFGVTDERRVSTL